MRGYKKLCSLRKATERLIENNQNSRLFDPVEDTIVRSFSFTDFLGNDPSKVRRAPSYGQTRFASSVGNDFRTLPAIQYLFDGEKSKLVALSINILVELIEDILSSFYLVRTLFHNRKTY